MTLPQLARLNSQFIGFQSGSPPLPSWVQQCNGKRDGMIPSWQPSFLCAKIATLSSFAYYNYSFLFF